MPSNYRANLLADYLAPLDLRHQQALSWFVERAGQEVPWPDSIDTEYGKTLVATKAKGIYKPKWSKYALSVRHSLGSPYPDLDPVIRDDGTWSYAYFQEGLEPRARDEEFTNRALMQCLSDRVPVAVFRQLSEHPARYEVLGLALVAGWGNGYFLFDGFARDGYGHQLQFPSASNSTTETVAHESVVDLFSPSSAVDERARVIAQVVQRRGQPQFRSKLLVAYERECAISRCDAAQALEACHIFPYLGPRTNHVSNGLLLRADIHTIFDLGLIAINPASLRIEVSRLLIKSSYGQLKDSILRLPKDKDDEPNRDCLAAHREWAGF